VLAPSSLALPTPLTKPWHPVLELESLSCPLNDASRPSSWLRPKRLPRRRAGLVPRKFCKIF
jgi:hypothetical protein